jgi:hypothetical protein
MMIPRPAPRPDPARSRASVHGLLAGLLLSLALLSPAARGETATFLFLRGEPGDYISGGSALFVGSADGAFTAGLNYAIGVSVSFQAPFPGSFWYLDFAAPGGAPLVPGAYEGATRFPFQSLGVPGLSVGGDGRGCNTLTGRFIVHEMVYGTGDEIMSFAADFEQHCEGGAPALFGSIRFHAGDAGCIAALDGAPCDDHDTCTTGETCQAGGCTGLRPESCGAASTPCEAARICDPANAQCVAVPLREGSACDDASACTAGDTCQAGECVGSPVDCEDGDSAPRIADPATGRQHRPAACFQLTGHTTATASANGRIVRRRGPVAGLLLLTDDARYREPSGASGVCPTDLPDEIGTYRPGRRGRLVLEPENLDAILQAVNDCLGYRLRIRRYRVWLKLAPTDSRSEARRRSPALCACAACSAVHGVSRFRGSRLAPARSPGASPRARRPAPTRRCERAVRLTRRQRCGGCAAPMARTAPSCQPQDAAEALTSPPWPVRPTDLAAET